MGKKLQRTVRAAVASPMKDLTSDVQKVLLALGAEPPSCGLSSIYGYQRGCRCPGCTKANSDYYRRWRSEHPRA